MKNILVTGGSGYIGSHTVVALAKAGFTPIIVDNFTNSRPDVLPRLQEMIGRPLTHYEVDCSDTDRLYEIMRTENIEGLIHFAALKAVGESVEVPLHYYRNNVSNFIGVAEVALSCGVNHIVFSSTAAVYGQPDTEMVTEETPCAPESPYGWSKRIDEIVLRDACTASHELKGVALRYFNVVGSDESATIGESSKTKPQNILPIIVEVVAGKRESLIVYGNDYSTPDGTCLRDYIHVTDLAEAHIAALRKLASQRQGSFDVYNISTGAPTSVLGLIKTFERVNNVTIPYSIGPRRAGDPMAYYAAADKARHELGWVSHKTIEDACRDAWRWQTQNPHGYH